MPVLSILGVGLEGEVVPNMNRRGPDRERPETLTIWQEASKGKGTVAFSSQATAWRRRRALVGLCSASVLSRALASLAGEQDSGRLLGESGERKP